MRPSISAHVDRGAIHRPVFWRDWVAPDRLLLVLDWGDGYGDPVWSVSVEISGQVAEALARRLPKRWGAR